MLICLQSESDPIWVISLTQSSSLPTPAKPETLSPKLHMVPSSLIPTTTPFWPTPLELEKVAQSFPSGNISTRPLLLYSVTPSISYKSLSLELLPPANQILPLFFSTIKISVSLVSKI